MAIFLTSDWHFNHDKDFIYQPRGFTNVEEMNETIIKNHNSMVGPEDEVYALGDLMMRDNELGKECISRLNGKIHVVRGNHDTDSRVEIYKNIPNIVEVCEAKFLKFKKWLFILSHYPTLVGNGDDPKPVFNCHGHTHSPEIFQFPDCYNVNPEAHNNFPILLDDIKAQIIARR